MLKSLIKISQKIATPVYFQKPLTNSITKSPKQTQLLKGEVGKYAQELATVLKKNQDTEQE